MSPIGRFLLADLRAGYRAGRFRPLDVVESAWERAGRTEALNLWITRLTSAQVRMYLERLDGRSIEELPLYGVPFVIKDNIDLAGIATTAACRAFAYVPERSATVVEKLIAAGAIPLGKTNLDQFATGLVGTRSPYGICRNSFNRDYISGGSSSGSAIAVALGIASFALGTDTAGSGRVPAAFNNIVGLKPSLGRLSSRGVVPACRSLDCVTVLASTAAEAALVDDVAAGFDPEDIYSRSAPPGPPREIGVIGLPRPDQLDWLGDGEAPRLFQAAVERVRALGLRLVEVDIQPLLDAASLLYDGPWVAERTAAVETLLRTQPRAIEPTVRAILQSGLAISAVEAFRGEYALRAYQRDAEAMWAAIDTLLLPTTPTTYRIREVMAEPLGLNANLGRYTNFGNLLDMSAIALPAGFRDNATGFGGVVLAMA